MKKEIMICPNCKGKKYFYDNVFGVFTLGLSYLCGANDICQTCNGKGYIVITL